jgi:hypothetical protein
MVLLKINSNGTSVSGLSYSGTPRSASSTGSSGTSKSTESPSTGSPITGSSPSGVRKVRGSSVPNASVRTVAAGSPSFSGSPPSAGPAAADGLPPKVPKRLSPRDGTAGPIASASVQLAAVAKAALPPTSAPEDTLRERLSIFCTTVDELSELSKASQSDEAFCQDTLESLRATPNVRDELKRFFVDFPKGENHVHGESLIKIEDYLAFVASGLFFYDQRTGTFEKEDSPGKDRIPSRLMVENRQKELKDKMSLAGCPKGVSQREYFFKTVCPLIDSISALMDYEEQHRLMMLEVVRQNYTYIPIMIDLPKLQRQPDDELRKIFEGKPFKDLEEKFNKGQLSHQQYKEALEPILEATLKILQKGNALEIQAKKMDAEFANAEAKDKIKAGKVPPTVKYIVPVMRTLDRDDFLPVFILQTAEVFAAMSISKRIRGYQLIGDESDFKARKHFITQLFAIRFFQGKFGGNVALHAGELTNEVASDGAIHEQIMRSIHLGLKETEEKSKAAGGASVSAVVGARAVGGSHPVRVQRISHALACALTDADIKEIVEKGICIEICLTSNELLNGILPLQHVIHKLIRKGALFTINGDDHTHFGITLTDELVNAIQKYGLTYLQIKNAQRVLRHCAGELDGESIYENKDNKGILVLNDTFKDIYKPDWKPSAAATKFMEKSEKAREQVRWELLVAKHEADFKKKQTDPEPVTKKKQTAPETVTKKKKIESGDTLT